MEETLIDFEDLKNEYEYFIKNKGKSLGIRRDFRIPLEGLDLSVEIDGSNYRLKNISSVGFKIMTSDIKKLQLEKEYDFSFHILNETITGKCMIVYFQKNNDDMFYGGVEIVSMSELDEKKLKAVLAMLKKQVLSIGKI